MGASNICGLQMSFKGQVSEKAREKSTQKSENEMMIGNFLNGNCTNLVEIFSPFCHCVCKPKYLWCALDGRFPTASLLNFEMYNFKLKDS